MLNKDYAKSDSSINAFSQSDGALNQSIFHASTKRCWCGNDKLNEFSKDYYKCDECDTLITKFKVDESLFNVQNEESDLYGEKYWSIGMAHVAGVETIEELLDLYFSYRAIHWVKYIFKYSLPSDTIAEIGCGLGQLSYLMKQIGYNQVAYELSPRICDFCRKTFDINIKCGDFDDSNDKFDLMVAIDLIEHMVDPVQFVQKIYKHSNPDSIFCIQTSIYDPTFSYEDLVSKKPHCLKLLAPEGHIFLFSKKAIEKLLKTNGFNHIVYEPTVFGDDYEMFLFASRNPIKPFGPSEIYDALKKQENGWLYRALIKLYDEKREQVNAMDKLQKDNGKLISQDVASAMSSYNAILQSTSWKMTKPIRFIADILKNFK